MSYYDQYGDSGPDSAEELNQAINQFSNTIANAGATWSDYKGKEADRQLQWDMLKYQLDYNKPSNQMARLRQAGLNPYNIGAVSAGNLDSLPNMGESPYSAIASGLTREAQFALQRISSQTALKEAQLRSRQVSLELRRVAMAEDLFPIQRKIAANNAYTGELTNEFLNSSMQERLNSLLLSNKSKGIENVVRGWFSTWMSNDGRGYDYYDEVYRSLKSKNDYTDWLKSYQDERFDYQKSRDEVLDTHWDIINNPFGLDASVGSINSILNTLFSFLRLFIEQ